MEAYSGWGKQVSYPGPSEREVGPRGPKTGFSWGALSDDCPGPGQSCLLALTTRTLLQQHIKPSLFPQAVSSPSPSSLLLSEHTHNPSKITPSPSHSHIPVPAFCCALGTIMLITSFYQSDSCIWHQKIDLIWLVSCCSCNPVSMIYMTLLLEFTVPISPNISCVDLVPLLA